jgi:hypothetical protein
MGEQTFKFFGIIEEKSILPHLLFGIQMEKIRKDNEILKEQNEKFSPKIKTKIPYIEEEINCKLTVNPEISLKIGPSNLKPLFVNMKKNIGVFTDKFIEKGTIITNANDGFCNINTAINYAIFNLSYFSLNCDYDIIEEDIDLVSELKKIDFEFGKEILSTYIDNSEKFYQEWRRAQKLYSDIEKLQEVNVIKITDKDFYQYYKSTKNINAGDELLRLNEFLESPFILLRSVTNKTIVGFAQFINEIILEDDQFKNNQLENNEFKEDRLREKIKILHYVLSKIKFPDLGIDFDIFNCSSIFTIEKKFFDKIMLDKHTINIGNEIDNTFFKDWLDFSFRDLDNRPLRKK